MREPGSKELQRTLWHKSHTGLGYYCNSSYNNKGMGKEAKVAADHKQPAITKFFSPSSKKRTRE